MLLGHRAVPARFPDDEQPRDVRLRTKARPSVPRRESRRFRHRPPDELLESTKLRLDLGGNECRRRRVMEPEVDPAARRPMHGDLGVPNPSSVGTSEHHLGDRRLDVVADGRTGGRIQTERKIGAEAPCQADARFDRGICRAGLDLGDVARVDDGGTAQFGSGHTGILAQSLDVRSEANEELPDVALDDALRNDR